MNNDKYKMRKRDVALDCLKGFAIFLVLWGHCIQYMSHTQPEEQTVYRIIYSFQMPLFMALVGYFAHSLLNIKSFFSFLYKKFRQLLLPALVFIAIMCVFGFTKTNGLISGVKHLVIDVWFLKVAFICTLLFYVSAYNTKWRFWGIAISLILSQFIHLWYWQINIMYPCFVFGYLMRVYRPQIENISNVLIPLMGIVFLGLLMFWDSSFWHLPQTRFLPAFDKIGEYWFKTFYRVVIGISGTLLFFLVFVKFEDIISRNILGKILERLGKITLGIYLVQ